MESVASHKGLEKKLPFGGFFAFYTVLNPVRHDADRAAIIYKTHDMDVSYEAPRPLLGL